MSLTEFAPYAVAVERRTGLPAALIIAQWAVESAWGAKQSGRFNYFGITKASRHAKWAMVPTREVLTAEQLNALPKDEAATITRRHARPDGRFDVALSRKFAAYETLEEGLLDYATLITSGAPYAKAWAAFRIDRDMNALIDAIAKRYATDLRYAELVKRIAEQANVRAAIETAKARAN